MADNAAELRALLTKAARTGQAPTHTEISAISLSGSLAERKRARTELSEAVNSFTRYAGRKDDSLPRRIDDIVNKFGGGGDETPDVSQIPRQYGTVEQRTGYKSAPTRTPLSAMESVLRHVALTKTPLTSAELAELPVDPKLSASDAETWRCQVRAASQRVADLSESGNQGQAVASARESAAGVAGGPRFADPVDKSESARLPDGTYDVGALMATLPPRAL
jgi:hypothetical protein